MAHIIGLLNYDGRRLALEALGVPMRVWSTSHSRRYKIKMLPGVAGVPINGPLTKSGGGHGEAHVRASNRYGCARQGVRHAGPL
jgi:hypothetical protein